MGQRNGKRDRQKEMQWREHVYQQVHSGQSVRAYCRQFQLAEPSFYAWRKELAKRDRERQADAPASSRESSQAPPSASQAAFPGFTEVVLTAPATVCPIEIVLADSRRIAVSPGFDLQTLQEVLEVLERPRC